MKPPPNKRPTRTTPLAKMEVISRGAARKFAFAAFVPLELLPLPLPEPEPEPEVLVAVEGVKLNVALLDVPPPSAPVAVAVDCVMRGIPVKLCATLATEAVDITFGIPLLSWMI